MTACVASPAPPNCPDTSASAPAAPPNGAPSRGETSDDAPSQPASLLVELRAASAHPAKLHVRLTATRISATVWSFGRVPDSPVLDLSATDAAGPVEVHENQNRLELARAPSGRLVISYTLTAQPFDAARPLATAVDPNRLRVSGESVLALPDDYESRPLSVTVRIDTKMYPDANMAASSLGVGHERSLELTMAALRRASFIAGPMGHAKMNGPEGHDEAAWLGFSSFDPRSVAAEVAGFRTGAREYFAAKRSAPLTLLIVSDGRAAGQFDAARRTASVLVHVGAFQKWTAPIRMTVAHQVLREWMGAELALVPEELEEVRTLWFTEGVTRYLARELLWRFGLLGPEEYRDEVEALLALVATHRRRNEPNEKLVGLGGDPTLVVARGALYATLVDRAIKIRSNNKASMNDVLRSLFAQARTKRAPLPEAAWHAEIEKHLGAGASDMHRRHISEGKLVDLESAAIGKCFRRVPKRYDIFGLGFETVAKKAAKVDPRGPAHRAGVREGDEIVWLKHDPGRTDVDARIRIRRNGKTTDLTYRPITGTLPGYGFTRIKTVRDEDCRT